MRTPQISTQDPGGPHETEECPIDMAKHENKSTGNGQGNFDPTRTKKVEEAGSGKHSGEDRDDKGQDDRDDEKE